MLILNMEEPTEIVEVLVGSNGLVNRALLLDVSLKLVSPTRRADVVVPIPVNWGEISSIKSTLLEITLMKLEIFLFSRVINLDCPSVRVSSPARSKSSLVKNDFSLSILTLRFAIPGGVDSLIFISLLLANPAVLSEGTIRSEKFL